MERIGNIILNDAHYPGEDKYCDGKVEDTLLSLVRSDPKADYHSLDPELQNWPTLYHLSPLRENIISWIPIGPMDKVLEIGSGCGAITGALAKKAGTVTCVELSRKRSLINAYRHQEMGNVEIRLGNYQDIEPHLEGDYDYIFLIGVLEYSGSYINSPNPYYAMISSLKKHLAPLGRLVIAIENRLGLKYFAGNMEDHAAAYFTGIEGYPGKSVARTFSRNRLDELCRACGFKHLEFYYPYPDYKFMHTLYSDERLPRVGELTDNIRNFDHERLYFFNEKDAFDAVISDGLFPMFSNSFLVIAGPSLPVVYAKYSNDRSDKFSICTQIQHPTDGVKGSALAALLREKGTRPEESYDKNRLEVRKIPLSKEASIHVAAMEKTYEKLKVSYPGNGLLIASCRLDGDQAVFPYLEGKTLEEVLDQCVSTDNYESFRAFFDYYLRLISETKTQEQANYDFIFSNIIITNDNRWHLIDYEWMPPKKATITELAARALYCYSMNAEKRKPFAKKLLNERFGYNEEDIEKLSGREERFQRFATGGDASMIQVRNDLNMPVIQVMHLLSRHYNEKIHNRIQIYEDFGEGYSEENSYFLTDTCPEKQEVTVDIRLGFGIKGIRLDPALDYCMLYIRQVRIRDREFALSDLTNHIDTNGVLLGNGLVLFSSEDPYIAFNSLEEYVVSEDETLFSVDMEMVRISANMGMASALIGVEDDEEEEEETSLVIQGGELSFADKIKSVLRKVKGKFSE